jgi:hypothetical protein
MLAIAVVTPNRKSSARICVQSPPAESLQTPGELVEPPLSDNRSIGDRYLPAKVVQASNGRFTRMDEAQEVRRHYENRLPEGRSVNDLPAVRLSICARQKDRDNWIGGFRKAGFDL